MKKITAIKIDVVRQEIIKVELESDNLDNIDEQLALNGRPFDVVHIYQGVVMFVDDEGLLIKDELKLGAFAFKLNPRAVFSGHGLVVGIDEQGASIDCQLPIEVLLENVVFCGIDQLPKLTGPTILFTEEK